MVVGRGCVACCVWQREQAFDDGGYADDGCVTRYYAIVQEQTKYDDGCDGYGDEAV